jgi:hypothetical protein
VISVNVVTHRTEQEEIAMLDAQEPVPDEVPAEEEEVPEFSDLTEEELDDLLAPLGPQA